MADSHATLVDYLQRVDLKAANESTVTSYITAQHDYPTCGITVLNNASAGQPITLLEVDPPAALGEINQYTWLWAQWKDTTGKLKATALWNEGNLRILKSSLVTGDTQRYLVLGGVDRTLSPSQPFVQVWAWTDSGLVAPTAPLFKGIPADVQQAVPLVVEPGRLAIARDMEPKPRGALTFADSGGCKFNLCGTSKDGKQICTAMIWKGGGYQYLPGS